MTLSELTDRNAVVSAIAEYDRLGAGEFLARYGYQPARSYYLVAGDRLYDSKAIAGVAHGYQFPDRGPLRSQEFSGGLATVVPRLTALGFEVRVIDESVRVRDYWWTGVAGERFWVEIRRVRERFGLELRCPLADRDGDRNGWYDLLDDLVPGDVVYHWNAEEARFLGRSLVASPRSVDAETGERIVQLRDFAPISAIRYLVGTDTVTAQGHSLRTRHARSGDF